jgi:hypothetical protein
MQRLGHEDGSWGWGLDRARARGRSRMSQEVAQTEAANSHPGQDEQGHDGATYHEDLRRPQPSGYDGPRAAALPCRERWRFR